MRREIASSCLIPLWLLGCSQAAHAPPAASAVVARAPAAPASAARMSDTHELNTGPSDAQPGTVLAVRGIGVPAAAASAILAAWLPLDASAGAARIEVIIRTADGALTAMVLPRDPALHPGARVEIARDTGRIITASVETAAAR